MRTSECTILVGDCRTILPTLPEASVQCCVTSPPYFGLRDYGHDGQIGLEQTPDAYVAEMVAVFREVRRVLRDDGTLWLNLGDSYAKEGGKHSNQSRHWDGRESDPGAMHHTRHVDNIGGGFKPKDLLGIPWRVAFALQADGWYLRQDIIWHKPNPMPESVTDRCTKAHEYVFLLSKSARYFYDAGAIAEEVTASTVARVTQPTLAQQAGSDRVPGKTNGNMKAVGNTETRNARSVWTITTKPFKGSHFATMPPELAGRCIKAGSAPGDTVLDPFGGSGTTAAVAVAHGRRAVLCELNPTYADLSTDRVGPMLCAMEHV
jgi:DNA modification methylase